MPLQPDDLFPLRPPLPLPAGVTEAQLFTWLKQVRVDGADSEIANYCAHDFRRFAYTFGLVEEATAAAGARARCLELGANPYFSTMLLKQFTSMDLVLANFFGDQFTAGVQVQGVSLPESVAGGSSPRAGTTTVGAIRDEKKPAVSVLLHCGDFATNRFDSNADAHEWRTLELHCGMGCS